VFEVYRVANDNRTLPFLKELTKRDPTAWLDMYEYGIQLNPGTSVADRTTWIGNYTTSVNRVHGKQIDGYRLAIERLVRHGDNALAIRLADEVLGDNTVQDKGTQSEALVLRLKGMAHARSGEKTKAEEAYRACLSLESQVQGEDVRLLIRKELTDLQKDNPVEKGGL
jgi:hypothetical protein